MLTVAEYQESMLLFLDFETTGIGTAQEPPEILETAAMMYDVSSDTVFEESENSWLTLPLSGDVENSIENDHVLSMHTNSGLITDLKDEEIPKWTLSNVENSLLSLIDRRADSSQKVFLAGSGTSGFDHRLIDWYMPRLSKRIHYSDADVRVARVLLLLFGHDIQWGEGVFKAPEHRALCDVKQSISQFRWLREGMSFSAPDQVLDPSTD